MTSITIVTHIQGCSLRITIALEKGFNGHTRMLAREDREREEKREERGRRQLTIDMIAFLPSAYSSIYTVWMEHSRMFYSILLPSIGFFHVPQASISFQGLPCHSIEVHGIPGSLPLFRGVSMPYYGSPIIVTLILRVVPLNLGLWPLI